MGKTFQLEIITPERQFYTGPVESLVLPALDGEYGVLPGHEPVVTAVEPGEARFKADGVWHNVIVTQGFAEITSEYPWCWSPQRKSRRRSMRPVPNAPRNAPRTLR